LIIFFAILSYGLFRDAPPPHFFYNSDKWLHVGAFMILVIWSRFAFSKIPTITILSLITVFAMIIEPVQSYISPHRTASWFDFGANIIGILLGMLFLSMYRLTRSTN
jgi:VanZ family protein